MPKLVDSSNYKCFLCGGQAFFISVNAKKPRCVEKVTQCPGFIRKAESSRSSKMSKEDRRAIMKELSIRGNSKLKELHNDEKWLNEKSENISNALKNRGGHVGKNNPMYGKAHKSNTLKIMKEKAVNRNPECYKQATNTKILRGISICKSLKTEWELYREQVFNYTNISWKYYQDEINIHGFDRGQHYELDHKFSITEGFKQRVDPSVIGHYTNLELIPKNINRSKRTKCSITLDELLKLQNK